MYYSVFIPYDSVIVNGLNPGVSVVQFVLCDRLLKVSFGEFRHFHAKSFSRLLSIKDFRNRKLF